MNARPARTTWLLPVLTFIVGVALLLAWRGLGPGNGLSLRVPGTDQPSGLDVAAALNPPSNGKLLLGSGVQAPMEGSWTQFRGPDRNGTSPDHTSLARSWDAAGPRELWAVD